VSGSEVGADRRCVAARIRAERLSRGWTLRYLGSCVDTSVAHLSAIENARQSPDVDLLVAIARALGVPLDRLMPTGGAPAFWVSRQNGGTHLPMRLVDHAKETQTVYHNRLRPLASPVVGKRIEPFDIEVWPVSDAEMRFISHHREEFLLVLSGAIECLIRTPTELRREVVSAGDCIHFWSYLPHCLRSTGAAPARSIHVLCSLDDLADSEMADAGAGLVFLMDGTRRSPSARIGEQLELLRRRRGMGVTPCARHLGMSARRLVAIERGRKAVSVDSLLEMCHAFGKPVEYFLQGSLDVTPHYDLHRGLDLQHATPKQRGARRRWPCVAAPRVVPLTTLSGRRMTPALLRIAPGVVRPLVRHAGQDFFYVLKGSVRVTGQFGEREEVTILSAGESCFLDGSIPHAFEQTQVTPYESGEANVLAVSWRPR
jgi:transcriptional regulator with XRE-family HTH domain